MLDVHEYMTSMATGIGNAVSDRLPYL